MSEVAQLEGWTALPEAASKLGMSRQGLHFRVNQGLIPGKYVRAVITGSRQLVLISNTYIEKEQQG